MPQPTTTVFNPITVGSLKLRNRIVKAPMARSRADATLATSDMATYYAQRASATAELALPNMSKAYGRNHHGYTDYPARALAA